uniref:undecaprenyldiphospho-muramoylpentapeptide beta-N-acetylglucosaminyltransferase n=1 Tax=Eubacterium cellulosolvens TaxID=29322 RepID=UPI0004837D25|nr:undecaprenyldiphospho-muramoylpentapeptide beta-N-acetylglucosaminyltransferase [[Eubacterium] cellulosolvens]
MKHIVLTGGGTAGHVTPNIALIPHLKELGYEISYIGSYMGIEKSLIEAEGIPYYGIATGKLRRYIDLKNLSDPFRVIKGYFEARKLIKKLKPDIVFSKGGFVSVPVVFAASSRRVPVIIHESDMTPGLANRLSIPKASRVCCNFPETLKNLPEGKAIVTGTPIREELKAGDKQRGLSFTKLSDTKPVILVMGGSLGAVNVNNHVREALPELLKKYQVVHLCGKGHLDDSLKDLEGYRQYEYIKKELPDLFAMADLIISRAGANAICEISSLAIPNLLIPLSAQASRGDQILNAHSFEKQGYSLVLEEENLTKESLLATVEKLYENRDSFISAMKNSGQTDSIPIILKLIEECRK